MRSHLEKVAASTMCGTGPKSLKMLETPTDLQTTGHPFCLLHRWHRDLDELQGLSRLNLSSWRVQAALRVSGRIGRQQGLQV